MKVYAFSDLHIDYRQNFDHLLSLKHPDYTDAALMVPGDATDKIDKLEALLSYFTSIFAAVFFVPGNHELWVRNKQHPDSIAKFDAIQQMCQRIGVHTDAVKVGTADKAVWVVPLFSWYTKAEEGEDTLYDPKPGKDQTEEIWSDNMFCSWTPLPPGQRVVDYFLSLNETRVAKQYDAPVLSFSHFLPLSELAFPLNKIFPASFVDPIPQFNFSRVAGTSLLDKQIRAMDAVVHVYGHQHRNRHREVDGITYISHCLGYPRERARANWRSNDLPKLIWDDGLLPVEKAY